MRALEAGVVAHIEASVRAVQPQPGDGRPPGHGRTQSAGGSGEVGDDDESGVPVERDAGAVVAHCRSRVGVRSGFLYVS